MTSVYPLIWPQASAAPVLQSDLLGLDGQSQLSQGPKSNCEQKTFFKKAYARNA